MRTESGRIDSQKESCPVPFWQNLGKFFNLRQAQDCDTQSQSEIDSLGEAAEWQRGGVSCQSFAGISIVTGESIAEPGGSLPKLTLESLFLQ